MARWERQDIEVALPELPAAPWSISWRWKGSTLEQRLWDQGRGDALPGRRQAHGGGAHGYGADSAVHRTSLMSLLPCPAPHRHGLGLEKHPVRTCSAPSACTQAGLHMPQSWRFQLLLLIPGGRNGRDRGGSCATPIG